MQCDYTGITHETLPYMWGHVTPLLERALRQSHGEYELEDIYNFVAQGHMQLWIAATATELQGIVVTELLQYPRKKVCHFTFIAGDNIDNWLGLEEVIESWAHTQGCQIVRGIGRRGWKKILQPYDFRESYTMFDKVINVTGKEMH